ncbi:hypothetical protein D0T51_01500 [Parabacteroides sp. 52]|uniref:outer membrane beta-barrel protein n=1 Tax=unclassified Parabacteroides TaxID=2649774 RepID=UPI0013CF4318|nr:MULTISPECIES: outer membrane beta-barrel protein [unclassified Parabacteroides]MDH6533658.1 hypothetical protein [Parabacteroides sp. PM5-20]NDV54410.1 hypothetical protein [Parabacteroides sp. 52]
MKVLHGACLFTCLAFATAVSAQNAQKDQKAGSYLSLSGSIGSSSFDYKLEGLKNEKGTREGKIGYAFDLRYSYFFDSHWGISSGVGISHYQTTGKLKGSMADNVFYKLGNFIDYDEEGRPRNFEFRTRLRNQKEKQTAYLLEVPILGNYQTRLGDTERWGIYAGLGIKLQLPVSAKFKMQQGANSQFNVSGYYEGIPTDMGSPSNPPVPQHGYGTITDPNKELGWDDDVKLKMGIAGSAELGVMVDLGKGMDLLLGGYMDYGFNDIQKKGNQALFIAPETYHPSRFGENNTPYIGKGITYNGMLNSHLTDKVKWISWGGKIALRFKL